MFLYVAVFYVLGSFVYNGECVSLRGECACPLDWAPVCGRDGTTYANKCQLDCTNVKIENEGPCGVVDRRDEMPNCPCSKKFAPVCGSNDVTYANRCLLDCATVTLKHVGKCRRVCVCPLIYSPVCGEDGVTYGNPCSAECEDVEVVSFGECNTPAQLPVFPVAKRSVGPAQLPQFEGCACPALYDPHCADDGRQFASECVARCLNVEVKRC